MTAVSYLTAKRTVDDRALDRRVIQRFASALADREQPVDVLEVGAGTGTMVARLAEWGLLPETVRYRAIDREATRIETARNLVPGWLTQAGYTVTEDEGTSGITADRGSQTISIKFEVGDAFDVEATPDALVACAVMDLVDLPEAVERSFGMLDGDGLLYAPITFDGVTGFVPGAGLDERIEACYHRHMAERDQPGGPRAGRRLLESIPEAGGEVLAAAGSDWLIRPEGDGYPHEEAVVLGHVLSTIVDAVGTVENPGIDPDLLDRWGARRNRELESGELTFLAHNLDVLARV